jgi:N,N'-diacetylchitobiose transport system permease protein
MQSKLEPPAVQPRGSVDAGWGEGGGHHATTSTPRNRRPRRDKLPYLLIAPAVIIVVGLMAYPLYRLVVLSLQQTPQAGRFAPHPPGPEFVGLKNFRQVLTDPTFWGVILHTVTFTVVAVGLSIGVSLAIALLMRRVSGWARLLVTFALVSVWAVPAIVATQVFDWLIDSDFGVVNYMIDKIPGVNFEEHSWFSSPTQGWTVITALVLWGAIPFLALMLYAGLTQVPPELIEAATIDGANSWQVFRGVILPIIKPVLTIATTLSVIWDFGIFNQIFVLRNTQPEESYWTVAIYAYEKAFAQSNYNAGATITLVTTVLMIGVMVFYIRQMIKMGEVD